MILTILILCSVLSALAALASVGHLIWTLTDNWRLKRFAAKYGYGEPGSCTKDDRRCSDDWPCEFHDRWTPIR